MKKTHLTNLTSPVALTIQWGTGPTKPQWNGKVDWFGWMIAQQVSSFESVEDQHPFEGQLFISSQNPH